MAIRILDEEGDLLVRDALVLCFFCKLPAADVLAPFQEVLDRWLELTPPEAKGWLCVGENADTYKPFTTRLMGRYRAQLDSAKASKRHLSCGELVGPEKVNPDFVFDFRASRESDSRVAVLELRFPAERAEGPAVEEIVAFARWAAERVPYDSAYASMALCCGGESMDSEFAEAIPGLFLRHPGFDIAANGSTRHALGLQLRGAYWLTFLGPDALDKLGGVDTLREKLDPTIALEAVGRGVMLRVGTHPEIGDVNRGEKLPLLRSLAQVLEPVLLIGDGFLNNYFLSDDERLRWERRHLD